MRKGWLVWVLGASLVCGRLGAQSVPATSGADNPGTAEAKTGTASVSVSLAATPDEPPWRTWGQVDYLLWWVRGAPLPVPIVTTGNPSVGFDPAMLNTVNTAGAVGQRGTQVLLGDSPIHFPAASGMRLTFGCWIDCDKRLGVEWSGFFLEQLTSHFAAGSDGAGSPPLYFPIFSGVALAERAVPIADPLRKFSGSTTADSTLCLWGAESNFVCQIYRCPGVDFSLLAGFRIADLRESFQIRNSTKDLIFGNVTLLDDSFRTTNQFYGGQIGARLGVKYEQFSLDMTGTFAVGSAHQMVHVVGNIAQVGPNPLVPPGSGTFPGGLFAQPSNIGERNENPVSVPFMIMPALALKLGYQITPHVRAFAGYDLLYWSQVIRPGSQINHAVNLSQNAVLDPRGLGTLVGPPVPAPAFTRNDFSAQGASLGFEVSF